MGPEDVMFQADIGGGARVDPGHGVQRPGYMVRDFALSSSQGEDVRVSSFRGQTSLVLVFSGYSDALCAFLDEAARRRPEFSEQEAIVVVILPYAREERGVPSANGSPILELYDDTHSVHHLSGASDGKDSLVPVVYVTDRYGEIVSTYAVSGRLLPPTVDEILRTLEFVNHQCPECEPPEWPR